jgi:hypothetical protein
VIDTTMIQRRGQQVAYFYCKRNNNEPDRQNPDAILRAIVKQLASAEPGLSLQPAIVEEYRLREREGFAKGSLNLKASYETILKLTEVYPQITIILDALDEINVTTRDSLIKGLHHLVQKSSNLVKIFVSSRDDDDIVFHLEKVANLRIKASDSVNDINRFVEIEISRSIEEGKLLRGRVDAELRVRVITTLQAHADGM